jgi:hypothetical protein
VYFFFCSIITSEFCSASVSGKTEVLDTILAVRWDGCRVPLQHHGLVQVATKALCVHACILRRKIPNPLVKTPQDKRCPRCLLSSRLLGLLHSIHGC